MKISKLFLILVLALMTLPATGATSKPLFSSDSEEHWYYIYYENVSRVFTENGEGNALTHTSIAYGSNNQKWKLVGDQNSFMLVSANGRAVYKMVRSALRQTSRRLIIFNSWSRRIPNSRDAG